MAKDSALTLIAQTWCFSFLVFLFRCFLFEFLFLYIVFSILLSWFSLQFKIQISNFSIFWVFSSCNVDYVLELLIIWMVMKSCHCACRNAVNKNSIIKTFAVTLVLETDYNKYLYAISSGSFPLNCLDH